MRAVVRQLINLLIHRMVCYGFIQVGFKAFAPAGTAARNRLQYLHNILLLLCVCLFFPPSIVSIAVGASVPKPVHLLEVWFNEKAGAYEYGEQHVQSFSRVFFLQLGKRHLKFPQSDSGDNSCFFESYLDDTKKVFRTTKSTRSFVEKYFYTLTTFYYFLQQQNEIDGGRIDMQHWSHLGPDLRLFTLSGRNSHWHLLQMPHLGQENLFTKTQKVFGFLNGQNDSEFISFLTQVLTHLADLESIGLIHQNLKPENIVVKMLDNEGMTDFRYSLINFEFAQFSSDPTYSRPRFAPSNLMDGRRAADGSDDIWPFGIIVFSLVSDFSLNHEALSKLHSDGLNNESRRKFVLEAFVKMNFEANLQANLKAKWEANLQANLDAKREANLQTNLEAKVEEKLEAYFGAKLEAAPSSSPSPLPRSSPPPLWRWLPHMIKHMMLVDKTQRWKAQELLDCLRLLTLLNDVRFLTAGGKQFEFLEEINFPASTARRCLPLLREAFPEQTVLGTLEGVEKYSNNGGF